ncbi:MAG TPA: hypothetical protein P5572_00590 [Phycisphaerae bacterium]|nr:hypothetical protein [Phycisphaerae bacterium]
MMVSTVGNTSMRLSLVDKILLVAALAITVALFLTIGWMAIAPDDPQGAVSLVTHSGSVLMVLEAGLLAAVTAALATVMIGNKLPDVGVLAAAVGFAFVSLQGGTAEYLLIAATGGDSGTERGLAAKLAVESVVWFALLVVAMLVAGAVTRWCSSALQRVAGLGEPGSTGAGLEDLAITECPGLARLIVPANVKPQDSANRWNGVRTTAVMVFAGLVLYSILVSGTSPHMIRHGQTCFAVFAAFYLGGWVARRWFPTRTAFWGILAVPITLLLGYGWTVFAGRAAGRYTHLANIPGSDFLRALPLTFVSVGTIAAILAHWFVHPGEARAPRDPGPSARRPTRRRHGS